MWLGWRRVDGISDASQVRETLDWALSVSLEIHDALLVGMVESARYMHCRSLYRLDTTNADLAAVSRRVTSGSARIELYELLVEYGRNLALSDQDDEHQRVLNMTRLTELI